MSRVHTTSELRKTPKLHFRNGHKRSSLAVRNGGMQVQTRPYFTLIRTQRSLRDYQSAAIDAWFLAGTRGILAMATGTGKTFTALQAAQHLINCAEPISTIVIAAPFMHLADQWRAEFVGSDFVPVRAFEDRSKWQQSLMESRSSARALGKPLVLITTYDTLSTDPFIEAMRPFASNTLLIADECHYLGAAGCKPFTALPVKHRLGLSATPERHFDEEGTQALHNYFNSVVFEFGLAEAIEHGFLTPYEYFPELISLTPEESSDYAELSVRISKAAAMAASGGKGQNERLKSLLIRRARIVNNAENKLGWLRNKIEALDRSELMHTLVYTGDELFPIVLQMLGEELRIPVHSFTGKESSRKRADLLKHFDAGDIRILVAMKCLDEGVDVPATRTAYFLSSTSNPRQYVQRRGRILRTAPGKSMATVHDSVVIPTLNGISSEFDLERRALGSQLARVEEFASLASNSIGARNQLLTARLRANLPRNIGVPQ